jgi:hypothetical protein
VKTTSADATPAPPPKDRYFLDASDGDKDCYRDVRCKLHASTCPSDTDAGKYDDKWTKKLRAEETGDWCCYSRTLCEFPADH